MGYKNPKELLDAATALPAAIEAKLPAGAPKISTKLLEFDSDVISKLPDFPLELPDLPPVPELPGLPGATELRRRYVTAVEVTSVPTSAKSTVTPLEQSYTQPIEGVVGTVVSRRGM